jgi:nickel-dependent lactate racemase
MLDAETISDNEIRDAIRNPISTNLLKDLAKGKKKPIIIIDDLHRPTETYRILPYLLDDLKQAGIEPEEIDVLVSLGAHRPMSGEELKKKMGKKMMNILKVYNHNPYENLKSLGETSKGTPISVNRFLIDSDFKILVGSVIPHPYAGFGGGAKMILPGLSGIETIAANHRPVYGNPAGTIGRVDGNERREEIEEAADMVGIDFLINTISNSEGRTSGIFAGSLKDSYYTAVQFAQKVYSTNVPYDLDIGVFNAFPKDNGVIQSFNSLNVWSTNDRDRQVVKPGGTIVIISNCPDGVGYHGLTDKGMKLYVRRDRHGSFKEKLKGRHIIFFSPNLIPRDIHDFLPESSSLCRSWSEVIMELTTRYSKKADVAVFPCAPLQIDKSILA